MDFKLNEEQQMLQDTAARLVRGEYDFEKRERFRQTEIGFSEAFWQQLAELGLTTIPFAEENGGFGGGGVEIQSVMTELGRGLCLEPYLPSVIFGGGLVEQLSNSTQKAELLPEIAGGTMKVAPALLEPQSRYNLDDVVTRAEKAGDGFRLQGRKAVVIGGHCADKLIISARTSGDQFDKDGISLFIVDATAAGLKRISYETIDGLKGCDVILDNVEVGADAVLGELDQAHAGIDYQAGRAIAALCAEAVGVMEESISLTLEYLKSRKQFGVPIGKFQVLQHRMADMSSQLEQARSMATLAASVADNPAGGERSAVLAAAKNLIGRAGQFISEQSIQLHGGIGMTWEYSGAHYAKRLVMISHQWGDDDHHLEAFAKIMAEKEGQAGQ